MSNHHEIGSEHAAHRAGGGRYGFSYRVAERAPLLAAWVGTGKRVLDLGCRDGSLTEHYAAGNTVTGVDIDQQALLAAHERLGISTVWLDINSQRLPFDDGSMEVVVAGEVLEHLLDPAFAVGEVHRVLVPGGAFVGSVPNSFHWRARLAFLRGHSMEDPTHLHLFSRQRVLKTLRDFNPVELVPIGGIGGRRLPAIPIWLSQPLVRSLPTVFANDFLFRAIKQSQ